MKEQTLEDQSTQKPPLAKEPPPKAEVPPPEKDLSPQIERAVDREPLDQVRCVRVFGNHYRCNWWSRQPGPRNRTDTPWGGHFMDCVRKSRFLSATMQAGELVIKEVGPVPTYQQIQVQPASVEK